MAEKLRLVGKKFGHWKVIREASKSEKNNRKGTFFICECDCVNKTIRILKGTELRDGITTNCGCERFRDVRNLEGKQFSSLKVIRQAEDIEIPVGKSGIHWLCRCDCKEGKQVVVSGYDLINNRIKSCGHGIRVEDLTGEQFGNWKVIRRASKEETPEGTKRSYWVCECQCERKTIHVIEGYGLKHGEYRDCGCSKIKDITGMQFGLWKVLRRGRIGGDTVNAKVQYWVCECQCEKKTIRELNGAHLRTGQTTSCGCKRIYERNNDINRTKEQIAMLDNKETFKNELIKFEKEHCRKPNTADIALMIGVKTAPEALKMIRNRGLEEYVTVENKGRSSQEIKLHEFLKEKASGIYNIEHSNRYALHGQEIDIYIPDIRLGVEFNGMYWHSEQFKHKLYHQQKSIAAINKGIKLYHVFEDCFENEEKRNKILNTLKNEIDNKKEKINAASCNLTNVNREIATSFHVDYSIKEVIQADINVGLEQCGILICTLSANFISIVDNDSRHIEIVGYSEKFGINIAGAIERLSKYLYEQYGCDIIMKCDLSNPEAIKFKEGGFKLHGYEVPNSIWWELDFNGNIKIADTSVSETGKYKDLLMSGYNNSEIMYILGYNRLYDCGKAIYVLK